MIENEIPHRKYSWGDPDKANYGELPTVETGGLQGLNSLQAPFMSAKGHPYA